MARLHQIAKAILAALELPSMRDLGFIRDNRGRKSRSPEHKAREKLVFLWRAAQSGKTRKIQEIIKEDAQNAEFVNIVICDNIQLQVAQTGERMRRDCYRSADDAEPESDSASVSSYDSAASREDDRIEGDVFTWMSAGQKAKVREIADMIKEDEVKMVVCCSNKRRFTALMDLLENLAKSKRATKVKVWIDEADASVNLWSNPDFDFTCFANVESVCLVSATFNSVVRQYGRIKVLPFPDTHPDTYVSLKDCELWTHATTMTPIEQVARVLDDHPALCEPGARLFVPALLERATHYDMEVLLHKFGFAVLILNGERKEITFPDGRTKIPIKLDLSNPSAPMELSILLPKLLRDHKILAQFPFACTGQMCLGRGITFQSEEFLFDAGILPDIWDPATAYQCIARVLGNIAKWRGKTKAKVFFSEDMRRLVLAQERIAIHIAKEVEKQGWADVGVEQIEHVLTAGKPRAVREVDVPQEREMSFRVYLTEGEAKGALAQLEPSYTWRTRSFSKEHPGFYAAAVGGPAKVNSYDHTIKTLPNLTGGKGKTETRTMYVPCYLDVTDATTLRYVVPIPDTVLAATLAKVDEMFPPI